MESDFVFRLEFYFLYQGKRGISNFPVKDKATFSSVSSQDSSWWSEENPSLYIKYRDQYSIQTTNFFRLVTIIWFSIAGKVYGISLDVAPIHQIDKIKHYNNQMFRSRLIERSWEH